MGKELESHATDRPACTASTCGCPAGAASSCAISILPIVIITWRIECALATRECALGTPEPVSVALDDRRSRDAEYSWISYRRNDAPDNHNLPLGAGICPRLRQGFASALGIRGGRPTYRVELIADAKTIEHRRSQPFGQVPTDRDDEVAIFESGAIVLRIAERAGKLIPEHPAARMRALQWLTASLNSVEPFVMALAINDIFEADCPWSAVRHPKVVADLTSRLTDLDGALGDRQWLDGDAFTVGDLMMISVLGGLRGTNNLGVTQRLAGYVAREESRPAHRKAMADHLATFADMPPTGRERQ